MTTDPMNVESNDAPDAPRGLAPLRHLGKMLYTFRGVLPVPAFLLLLLVAAPSEVSFLAGILVAGVGEAGRLWALTYIGPKSRAEGKRRADRLIMEGPYSLTRNPLYVANLTIAAGLLLAANRWVLLLAVPLGVVYYYLVALAEEEFLAQEFPEQFARFRATVPRFFPRFRAPPPADTRFRLAEVFTPEISTLLAAELVLVLMGLELYLGSWGIGGEAFRFLP